MTEPNKELRGRVKQLAREAAWDEQKECDTCGGDGRVPGGRMIVHSRSASGFGADWELEGLLAAIDKAQFVSWTNGLLGHDLVVEIDGKPYLFEVKRPEDWPVAS